MEIAFKTALRLIF